MISETKITLAILVVIFIGFFLAVGPAGCNRRISAWKAAAYGSDWLVVQYSQDGDVINSWELKGKSIGSESNSDGIFFEDNEGNVVHLSGHYIYVETKDFEAAKRKYSSGW